MKFGEKLLAERKKRRLSQVAVAEAIGVSRFTLINYETGKSHPQDREIYFKLADFFAVDVNYFLTEDEEAIMEAAKRYGRKGDAQAEAVLEQASALFAGGGLSEHAQSAFIREMQAIIRDAEQRAKKRKG